MFQTHFFSNGIDGKRITINSIECDEESRGLPKDDVCLMTRIDGGPPIRFPIDGTTGLNSGDKVETRKSWVGDFDGAGATVKHKLDNSAGLFGAVDYHLAAGLLTQS